MNYVPPEVISLWATFVSGNDPRPIIPLTHVCRHWREAIISSPRNWASLDNGWKQLVPTCLRRAGAVPLTVNIKVSAIERDKTFIEAILPHASRVTHLSLTGYRSIEAMANVIPTFFTSTMHNLISLELRQNTHPVELFPSGVPPAFLTPWKLSRLTSLHLTRTPLYPAITSVTSLLDLKLDRYKSPFRFLEFIAFLGANPNLQSIALDVRFERPASGFGKSIILSRLRRLSLTCADPLDAEVLISSISLPRGVSLEVTGSSTNPCTALHPFLPSPPTRIQEILSPIVTIKYQNEPSMVQFYGNDSDFSFRCASGALALHPELSLFVVTAVRELHLKDCYYLDLSWLVSQLPALETLVMVGGHDSYSLSAFLVAEPVLCPSLKTIAFLNCELGYGIKRLEEAVARRKQSTAAWLHRIIIVSQTGDFPRHDLVLQLRKCVPCVDIRIDDKLPDLS